MLTSSLWQKYCSEKGLSAHWVRLAVYIGAARRLLLVGALRCLKSRIFTISQSFVLHHCKLVPYQTRFCHIAPNPCRRAYRVLKFVAAIHGGWFYFTYNGCWFVSCKLKYFVMFVNQSVCINSNFLHTYIRTDLSIFITTRESNMKLISYS